MHLSDDVLDQYAMGSLNETKTEAAEEHLLVCQHCRDEVALIDTIRAALRPNELGAGYVQ
jgi:anti-sigma factor RsiW